jgi:hypothetical protein
MRRASRSGSPKASGPEHFQGYLPVQAGIVSLVNGSHAAFADAGFHTVLRQGIAGGESRRAGVQQFHSGACEAWLGFAGQ